MTTSAKQETVLIVHGTFSGKGSNSTPQWYAPGQPFCQQLDEALKKVGVSARCWQHLQPGEEHFHWDGRNDWMSRRKAATRLRDLLARLRAQQWKVHLVGHSHGGNVIVDAITNDQGRVESWFRGRVALLGTPLYRDAAAFSVRKRSLTKYWLGVSFLFWGALLAWAARGIDVLAAFAIGSRTEFWASGVALIGLIFSTMLLYRFLKASDWRIFAFLYWYEHGGLGESNGDTRWSPAFMCINSEFDEALRSLSGLPEADDRPPILSDSPANHSFLNNLAAVIESGRTHLATIVASTLDTRHTVAFALAGVTAILLPVLWRTMLPLSRSGDALAFWIFVTSLVVTAWFFGALFFFPGVVLVQGTATVARGIGGLAALTFDGTIKKWVWGFTKALSLGLSGAPRRIQDISVERMLTSSDPEDCIYLELPHDIVLGVQQGQRDQFVQIQDILYSKTKNWLPTQLREHLESLDFPLVHTVYYRDPSCIQKIADWIQEPMGDYFDGRLKTPTTVSHGAFKGGGEYVTQEEFEGPNHYRLHLEELKMKHGPAGSRWGSATNIDKLSALRPPRGVIAT
jgi:hypothetical protein